jgi:ureidoglycolate lyase
MQAGSAGAMLFDCHFLVSYISEFMPLYPGDVIATGTPAGVGMGRTPPSYLRAGMTVNAGIERLGEQRFLLR